MSLKQYQQRIDDALQEFEKPYWHPLSMFARLTEEVGEVGRLLNHMYGDKPKKPDEAKQELPDELADILFAVICMANSHTIDLDEAMEHAIRKIEVRDAHRFAKRTDESKHSTITLAPTVKLGRYRHCKGGEYEVLTLVCDEVTHEWLVIYKALYDTGNNPKIWARRYDVFTETIEVDGKQVPRFVKIDN